MLVVPYLVVSDETLPLAIFVFPPLVTCALAGWRPTLLVTAVTVGVAASAEQFRIDPYTGRPLATRLGVIVLGGVFGAITAAVRLRREAELEEATTSLALSGALQLGLLPDPQPIAGFDVALRYRSGEHRLLVGGDFVDVLPLDETRLAFIVGDVCGHGPDAAARGAALRAGWRALVDLHPDDPVGWVHGLDRVYVRAPGSSEGHVTACTGIVDRGSGTAAIVSAGHPWPVVVSDEPSLVEMRAGQPMGLLPDAPASWAATVVTVGHGERLLVYTDGLIEARVAPGTTARRGHHQLLDVLRRAPRRADELLLDDLLEAMATEGSGAYEDDVAVLLIGPQVLTAPASRHSSLST